MKMGDLKRNPIEPIVQQYEFYYITIFYYTCWLVGVLWRTLDKMKSYGTVVQK